MMMHAAQSVLGPGSFVVAIGVVIALRRQAGMWLARAAHDAEFVPVARSARRF